jgi:hypothetical protein
MRVDRVAGTRDWSAWRSCSVAPERDRDGRPSGRDLTEAMVRTVFELDVRIIEDPHHRRTALHLPACRIPVLQRTAVDPVSSYR